MSEVKISISVDDNHLSQIEEISEKLKSLGMNVEQILSVIGVVNGSIESEKLNSLYQIKGVQNIERQENYQI